MTWPATRTRCRPRPWSKRPSATTKTVRPVPRRTGPRRGDIPSTRTRSAAKAWASRASRKRDPPCWTRKHTRPWLGPGPNREKSAESLLGPPRTHGEPLRSPLHGLHRGSSEFVGISQTPGELVLRAEPRALGTDQLNAPLHRDPALRSHRVDHHRRPRIRRQVPQLDPVHVEVKCAIVLHRVHHRHHVRPTRGAD